MLGTPVAEQSVLRRPDKNPMILVPTLRKLHFPSPPSFFSNQPIALVTDDVLVFKFIQLL